MGVPGLPILWRRGLDYLGLRRPPTDRSTAHTGGYGVRIARMHEHDEVEVGPLNTYENARLRRVQLFGTTGAILLAVASLGVGQLPVLQNPIVGVRVLTLPSRMFNTALALSVAGTAMLAIAWLLLGRYAIGRFSVEVAEGRSPARRMSRSQVSRTLVMWSAPLLLTPPILSKDVYSYLAQSAIAHKGLDPYVYSPLRGLGVEHDLTRSVPNLWRDTPAPYGPLFLWLGEQITSITGDHIVAAILAHRLIAIAGVMMIVWALPRLAARCGVSSVAALWIGALNPLLIVHLIGGIHNESLMLGLMLIGMELCLRAIDDTSPLWNREKHRPTKTGWILIAGAVIISASAMIKITSMLALGFAGIALARRWGATLPALRNTPARQWWRRSRHSAARVFAAAALMGAIALAVTLTICFGTGLGFGWTETLSTGGIVRSWMSLTTLLSLATGFVGLWLGLGDQTQAMLDVARPIGQLVAGILVVRWLMATLAGRIHPIGGLGVATATVVAFFPFVQAWYLLWAVIPLAAWATSRAFRQTTVLISAVIAVVVLPTTATTPPLVVATGLATGVIVVAIASVFFFIDHPIRSLLRRRRHPELEQSS